MSSSHQIPAGALDVDGEEPDVEGDSLLRVGPGGRDAPPSKGRRPKNRDHPKGLGGKRPARLEVVTAPAAQDPGGSSGTQEADAEDGGLVDSAAPVATTASGASEKFPYMPMLAVMVIVACDNIAFTQIFPYLAFLIVHLDMVQFDYQVPCVALLPL